VACRRASARPSGSPENPAGQGRAEKVNDPAAVPHGKAAGVEAHKDLAPLPLVIGAAPSQSPCPVGLLPAVADR
jgi:hypothetical protein